MELFAEIVQVFGVAKSVGQIYGLLYCSERPLCFSDIVVRLQISKGSASQGLQFLRSLGAVNISTSPSLLADSDSNRRDYYEPEFSLRKLVSGVLQDRVAILTTKGSKRLNRLSKLADGNDFYFRRVRQLDTWRRRIRTVLPLLSALLGPKART